MTFDVLLYSKDIIGLSKKTKITGFETEDISQELYLHLLSKKDQFNSERSSARTFVNRIINNKVKDLARFSNAQKRYMDNSAVSLDELIENGYEFKVNEETIWN